MLTAGAGIGLIAGCIGSDSGDGDDGSSSGSSGGSSDDSGSSSSNTQESRREEVVDDRRNVPEDEYYRWRFDVNRAATLEYQFTVREGPEVDVFVATEAEFDAYSSNERFRAVSRSSGIGGNEVVTLDRGTHYLVIDNTGAGWVSPPTNFDDDIADVEIEAIIEG